MIERFFRIAFHPALQVEIRFRSRSDIETNFYDLKFEGRSRDLFNTISAKRPFIGAEAFPNPSSAVLGFSPRMTRK